MASVGTTSPDEVCWKDCAQSERERERQTERRQSGAGLERRGKAQKPGQTETAFFKKHQFVFILGRVLVGFEKKLLKRPRTDQNAELRVVIIIIVGVILLFFVGGRTRN